MLIFVTSMEFTFWVRALRTRLSYWRRVWGCCSSSKAEAFHVVAPTQTRRQQPTRARSSEESRITDMMPQYDGHWPIDLRCFHAAMAWNTWGKNCPKTTSATIDPHKHTYRCVHGCDSKRCGMFATNLGARASCPRPTRAGRPRSQVSLVWYRCNAHITLNRTLRPLRI